MFARVAGRVPLVALLAGLLAAVPSPRAEAALIVVPTAQTVLEGTSNNGFPFNIGFFSLGSQRYQQVYDAGQFFALVPGGGLITDIAFRPDAGAGPFSTILPGVRIDLSTTAAPPDGLSTIFAANVGADNTTVYGGPGGAPLPLSSSFTGPPGGPKAFDIVIPLTTPFFYDPAFGNLLLDVYNFGGGTTVQFDAQDAVGDPISRVFTVAGGVGSPVADGSPLFFTNGLITQFSTTPAAVPEPGTLALTALGMLGLVGYLRKRKP